MAFQYTVSVNDPTNSPKAGALGAVVTAAAAQWSRWIRGGGTLDIQVNVATTSVGRANGGAATSTYVGMDGSRLVYENGTISELRSGRDPNGAAPDVIITVDPNYLSTLWLDANSVAPANMTDGLSVFMHEIGHAIGLGHAYDIPSVKGLSLGLHYGVTDGKNAATTDDDYSVSLSYPVLGFTGTVTYSNGSGTFAGHLVQVSTATSIQLALDLSPIDLRVPDHRELLTERAPGFMLPSLIKPHERKLPPVGTRRLS